MAYSYNRITGEYDYVASTSRSTRVTSAHAASGRSYLPVGTLCWLPKTPEVSGVSPGKLGHYVVIVEDFGRPLPTDPESRAHDVFVVLITSFGSTPREQRFKGRQLQDKLEKTLLINSLTAYSSCTTDSILPSGGEVSVEFCHTQGSKWEFLSRPSYIDVEMYSMPSSALEVKPAMLTDHSMMLLYHKMGSWWRNDLDSSIVDAAIDAYTTSTGRRHIRVRSTLVYGASSVTTHPRPNTRPVLPANPIALQYSHVQWPTYQDYHSSTVLRSDSQVLRNRRGHLAERTGGASSSDADEPKPTPHWTETFFTLNFTRRPVRSLINLGLMIELGFNGPPSFMTILGGAALGSVPWLPFNQLECERLIQLWANSGFWPTAMVSTIAAIALKITA